MPTDTSVKFLHSAMAGAPLLAGQAGSLTALLDACLVNGYGVGSVDSITIAGGVATVTRSAGHPFEAGSVALVAGAAVSGGVINGEQKVLASPAPTTTTYCFDATGIANQTATGTITHKVAPLGWSKAFTGTNLGAYKPSDVSATGCYLRVDDTGTTNARVVGYETMSDMNTGVGPFPTSAQVLGGGYWPKSASADSTARDWVLIGDGKLFYLAVAYTAAATYSLTAVFGDPLPVKSPDTYCCVLSCAEASPLGSGAGNRPFSEYDYGDQVNAFGSVFMPRSYVGLGSAVSMRKTFPLVVGQIGARSGAVTSGLPFPNGPDGGLYVAEHFLIEHGTLALRAKSPGLCPSLQNIGNGVFGNRESVTGVAGMAGRVLKALNTSGVFFVDTTGPWR